MAIDSKRLVEIGEMVERELALSQPGPDDTPLVLGWLAGMLCGTLYTLGGTKQDAHELIDNMWDASVLGAEQRKLEETQACESERSDA